VSSCSNIYYINDRLDKRTWTYIFGACCATTVFIPSFHNYRIWSFLGLGMTTYTAWYLAIAALINGQVSPQPPIQESAIPPHAHAHARCPIPIRLSWQQAMLSIIYQ
jgi:hypothetical protein